MLTMRLSLLAAVVNYKVSHSVHISLACTQHARPLTSEGDQSHTESQYM